MPPRGIIACIEATRVRQIGRCPRSPRAEVTLGQEIGGIGKIVGDPEAEIRTGIPSPTEAQVLIYSVVFDFLGRDGDRRRVIEVKSRLRPFQPKRNSRRDVCPVIGFSVLFALRGVVGEFFLNRQEKL